MPNTETTLEQDLIEFFSPALSNSFGPEIFLSVLHPQQRNLYKNIREKWKNATLAERKEAFLNYELDFQRKILENLPSFVKKGPEDENEKFDAELRAQMNYAEELGLFEEEKFGCDHFSRILDIALKKKDIPSDPEERKKEIEKDKKKIDTKEKYRVSFLTDEQMERFEQEIEKFRKESEGENAVSPQDNPSGAFGGLEESFKMFVGFIVMLKNMLQEKFQGQNPPPPNPFAGNQLGEGSPQRPNPAMRHQSTSKEGTL